MAKDLNLAQWSDFIENQIGFILPYSQRQWLKNAILATSQQYKLTCDELWKNVQTDEQIRQHLFDQVLIPESRFFRHKESLDFICDKAKEWQKQDQGTFFVWSAGCAAGQEVWSLAMCLQNANILNYQLIGTDVSEKSLHEAQQAMYGKRQLEQVPIGYRRFVELLPADRWTVVEPLKQRTQFIWHNIFLPETLPTKHQQNIIVCQNVLIYFREFDQRDILSRMVAQCRLGGYIILAAGEALFWHHEKMEKVSGLNFSAWRKIRD